MTEPTEPTPEEIEDFKLQELESRQRAYTSEAYNLIDGWAEDWDLHWKPNLDRNLLFKELVEHCEKLFPGEEAEIREILANDPGVQHVLRMWIAGQLFQGIPGIEES